MSTLVLDIETIPAVDPAAVAHLAARRDLVPEAFCTLCPPLARVVAVGMMNLDTKGLCALYDASVCGGARMQPPAGTQFDAAEGEPALLKALGKILATAKRLVTFNGRSYDVPVLIHRSLAHRMKPAPLLKRVAFAKPWEIDGHVDLINALSFGGAAGKFSLEAYCLGFGIDNPKSHGDGSAVSALVAARRADDLLAYCLADVRATAALYARWQLCE